ncbi:hypothetical protein ACK83U_19375 (plasmid) [Rhizobium sp. WW22]|uniref:hypothetical protein n=1 Tax=unclassified Rhizobium TaxID=2613769 RepID=UPI001621FDE9|nr:MULTISPECIES: hypothetical protein [unclassified Rhizobium]MBB3386296.1 hypothetical protein [Rhizobium sp. BK098]MBB3618000.1 hypothetical protein [Rhizobium sp. BK609]MBB3683548.1 hypothetical protein [Rhizobium sp. BK612]
MEVDEIDIDSLDEAALISLDDRIVGRLQVLDLEKTARALRQIKIGGRVMFEGPDNTLVSGIVVRRNRKTLSIQVDDHTQWNISPHLIRITQDDIRAQVEREMPFLTLNEDDYAAWIRANVPGAGKLTSSG